MPAVKKNRTESKAKKAEKLKSVSTAKKTTKRTKSVVAPPKATLNPDEKVRTLLLVDDDEVSSKILEFALHGVFKVTRINSGARAISQAIASQPDAILLDLHMPNIDGFEVLRQLNQHPDTGSIPIVCMSGDTDAQSRERANGLGAVGFLRKPFNVASVGTDIESLITLANVVVKSPDSDRKFAIAFSQDEKYRLMKEEVAAAVEEKKSKVVVLSLTDGSLFFDPKNQGKLDPAEIVYLQIIPSFLAKLPYLEDLSVVTQELAAFLDQPAKKYTAFIEDLDLIVQSNKKSKDPLIQLRSLKDAFGTIFGKVFVYCARAKTPRSAELLREMALLYCQ